MNFQKTIRAKIIEAVDRIAAEHGEHYPPVVEIRLLLRMQQEADVQVVIPLTFKSFEDWFSTFSAYLKTPRDGSFAWTVGDLFLYGSEHYPKQLSKDRLVDLVKDGKTSEHTMRNFAWICKAFPPDVRRNNEVGYTIHAELAGIADQDERCRMLDKAIRNKWTMEQTRQARKELKSTEIRLTINHDKSDGNQLVLQPFVSDTDWVTKKVLSLQQGAKFRPHDIHKAIVRERPEISRSTVYNVVTSLEKKGSIKRVRTGYYELPAGSQTPKENHG